jgi:hypothetical protein
MLWIIIVMLLVVSAVGFLVPYTTLIGAVIQILLIGTLVALGIHRICAVSSRIRRYPVN